MSKGKGKGQAITGAKLLKHQQRHIMETVLLAQRNSRNKIKYILFELSGQRVSRNWGLLGSEKIQETFNDYDYTSKGKPNEMSPEETAKAAYDKIIATKIKEGYQPIDRLKNAEALIPKLSEDSRLFCFANIPTGLCCSKPTASISRKKLEKLIEKRLVRFFTKYNGLCHYIVIDPDKQVKIYTRRWDDHTRKYPIIVKYVESRNYPANSMFITEFVIDPLMDIPHMKGFTLMSSISKANVSGGKVKDDLTKTLTRQVAHSVKALIFGICYWGGQATWKLKYSDMLSLIEANVKPLNNEDVLFSPTEVPFDTAGEAIRWTKNARRKAEGLVAWKMDEAMKMTFNGKPKRRAAYKIKDAVEMDVIAYGYLEGTGKLQGKIGSLLIGLINENGEFVEMGRTGSGLKPKNGDNDIDGWRFPCVIEVTYDQVFPTGKLQFPRFVKVHEDKKTGDTIPFEEHVKGAA